MTGVRATSEAVRRIVGQPRGERARAARRGATAGRVPARALLAVHGHVARQTAAGEPLGRQATHLEGLVTPSFWRDRPTFVTGATGLVGAWLVQRLRRRRRRRRLPRARLGAAVRAGALAACSSGCASCAATSATRPLLERRSASTRSTPSSTSRRRPSSAIANRNPVSTFETNIARHLALLEACRRSPTRQADRRRVVRQGLRRPRAAALRRGHAARRAAPLRREQVVRRPDRADLRRTPTACRSRSRAAATSTAAAISTGTASSRARSAPSLRGERPVIRSDGTVRARLLLRRGRRRRLHAARRGAGRRSRARAARPSTSRTSSRSRCSSWSSRILDADGRADLEPDVRNEASHEIRQQYLTRREGARACSAGSRSSRSTRASRARSPGTASCLDRMSTAS